MDVKVEDARGRLDQLLDLAASGVDVVVTREGKSPVRLVGATESKTSPNGRTPEERRAAIDRIVEEVRLLDIPPELRTSNHDDMYDELGLPK